MNLSKYFVVAGLMVFAISFETMAQCSDCDNLSGKVTECVLDLPRFGGH
jgi:hypothetical protein